MGLRAPARGGCALAALRFIAILKFSANKAPSMRGLSPQATGGVSARQSKREFFIKKSRATRVRLSTFCSYPKEVTA